MKNKFLTQLSTSSSLAKLCLGLIVLSMSPAWGKSSVMPEITFICEDNRGVPITVAKNNRGNTQTIFHWKRDALPTSRNPQELCDRTSEKFNDYAAEGNSLSSLKIRSAEQLGLPAICITEEQMVCSKVLFTLNPHEEPIDFAQATLTKILDHNLQNKYATNDVAFQGRCTDVERGCQSLFPSFRLNLFQDES